MSGLYLRERMSTDKFRLPLCRQKKSFSSEILCSIVQVPLKPFSPFAVASSRLQRLDNSTVRTYSCWQATQRRQHWLAVSSFPWLTKTKPPQKRNLHSLVNIHNTLWYGLAEQRWDNPFELLEGGKDSIF